jgi:hypothetical protein
MTFMIVSPTASIEVSDYKGLRAIWRTYGGPGTLLGRVIVRKRLTSAQRKRISADLRAILEEGEDGGI